MMIKTFFYFTPTVLNWKHILKADQYKDVLVESFKILVKKERVRIFAFVIMPNHFHAVWKINENLEKSDYQRDFMKYTGQTILRDLKRNQIEIYNSLYVGAKDRHHQFWERNPLSVPLYTQKVVEQKINYIHANLFLIVLTGILQTNLRIISIHRRNFIMRGLMSLGS